MAFIIPVGLLSLLLFAGCSSHGTVAVENPHAEDRSKLSKIKNATQEIEAFEASRKNSSAPAMMLAPVYQEISVFDEQKITFSAEQANFHKVMYSIAEISGLNLIIDKDVDIQIPVTISVKEAYLKEVLDIVMNISGCYYELKGNILHVKQFEEKSFLIPYVHSSTSFTTQLGGDMLSSASGSSSSGSSGGSSQGVKGEFKLKFDNPVEINNFYEQLEKNIASLLSADGKYTLNRFTGVLNVYDKKTNVDTIEGIIQKIKKQSNKQVLIEAKILEVVLNDNHSLGVSWDAVANNVLATGDQLQLQQTLGLSGAVAGTMTYSAKNFSSIITALDESGNVDTLSNPSINVLSGQSAVISSGKLIPFWEKEVQTTQGTGGSASNSEVTYNRRDVLNGVTMGVTPTVMSDNRIMLNIIPITSSIEDIVYYVDENGNSVASAPILNVKEAGTIVYAKNNDLVLIGGLINNTVSTKVEKIPWLSEIPWMGALFTRTVKTDEKRELVILIRLRTAE
jgi:MSHA biogenesis protein MshL